MSGRYLFEAKEMIARRVEHWKKGVQDKALTFICWSSRQSKLVRESVLFVIRA